MSSKKTTVAIVGDGNAAHVLIPFLGDTQHTVNLLSLNTHKWDRTVRCEVQNMKHEVLSEFHGDINVLSDDYAEVVRATGAYVSYADIVEFVEARAAEGDHIELVETWAEEVASFVLRNELAAVVRVTVQKVDIFDAAEGVGISIERRRIPPSLTESTGMTGLA